MKLTCRFNLIGSTLLVARVSALERLVASDPLASRRSSAASCWCNRRRNTHERYNKEQPTNFSTQTACCYSARTVLAIGWLSLGNHGFSQIEDDANSLAVTLNSLIRPYWSVYAIVLSALPTSCQPFTMHTQ